MKQARKSGWPKKIKFGNVTVKLYRTKDRGKVRYTLAYHEGKDGRFRRLRQFRDLDRASEEGKIIAERLNAGRGEALKLTGADRDAYLYATAKLRPLKVGLVPAIDEYIEAKKWIAGSKSKVTLHVATKAYAEAHHAEVPEMTIKQVYDEMLAAKSKDGASEAYLHDLKSRLGHFSRDFQTSIASVSTSDVDRWLRSLKLAPRSRNNHRNAIVSLFNFAKAAGYLDRDKSTAAEHTAVAKAKRKAISFFSPQDFAKLLGTSDKVILPMFVLGGFCGLRTEEIIRLSWHDVRWAESSIIISEDVAKQGEARRRRIAPLTTAAVEWLADYKANRGRVLPLKQPEHRVKSVCKAVGVTWRRNGLRHSFITYRVATEKDFVRVAYECGNYPSIIRSNYDAVATEAEGKLWFSIRPDTAKNVIRMKAAA